MFKCNENRCVYFGGGGRGEGWGVEGGGEGIFLVKVEEKVYFLGKYRCLLLGIDMDILKGNNELEIELYLFF